MNTFVSENFILTVKVLQICKLEGRDEVKMDELMYNLRMVSDYAKDKAKKEIQDADAMAKLLDIKVDDDDNDVQILAADTLPEQSEKLDLRFSDVDAYFDAEQEWILRHEWDEVDENQE